MRPDPSYSLERLYVAGCKLELWSSVFTGVVGGAEQIILKQKAIYHLPRVVFGLMYLLGRTLDNCYKFMLKKKDADVV